MRESSHPELKTVSGNPIHPIGLGTWGLGGVYYGDVPDDQGVATVRAYLDAGGNHIDTAYAYHKSEEVIGRAIAGYRREELFITSKTYAGSYALADAAQLPSHVEISLRDLGIDYLDAYLIHGTPRDSDHLNRLIDAFEKLRATGKIRRVGASIRGPRIDDESLATAQGALACGRLEAIQLSYSIARQKHAAALAEAHRRGVPMIVRWVLESGMLTGKYPVGQEFAWPDTRNRYRPAQRDGILQIGQDLKASLPAGFSSPREVCVAFVRAHPGVTGLILGANSPEHAQSNVALAGLPALPSEYLRRLVEGYGPRNDAFNPTGEFEHVDSPRRPLED